MSEQCQVGDYIFVLPYGGKIINCYYKKIRKDHTADRYLGKSAKDAKKAFEEIKAFKPIPLPENIKTYCDCTDKPCDPLGWFCHREFVAIRFLKSKRRHSNIGEYCHQLRTLGVDWIEALRRKTSETTGKTAYKLDSDVTMRALISGCGRNQAYAEYAQAFFYDEEKGVSH